MLLLIENVEKDKNSILSSYLLKIVCFITGLSYPEDSAARIMQENLTIPSNWSVGQRLLFKEKKIYQRNF